MVKVEGRRRFVMALPLHDLGRIPVVLAVVNNKGGVGKTTTSVNLGAALAAPKRRILLVDLDGQASASRWCGVDRAQLLPSSATCLLEHFPLSEAVRPTSTDHLDLVTGSADLMNVDVALCDVAGREATLRKALASVRRRYEFVILDCPPSLSLVGVNALAAADLFLVPVTPTFLAIEGLTNMLDAVDRARRLMHARVRLLGILLTRVRGGGRRTDARERVRAQYRERVFHTEIAESAALERAPSLGRTIFQCAPRGAAADAYRRLAGEVLQRVSGRK